MVKKLTITNTIRTLRFFAGEMTQQQLAEKAGVSRQTVIAVEAGKYAPSLELAFRIANVFGVEIGEVFACEDDPGTDAKAAAPWEKPDSVLV